LVPPSRLERWVANFIDRHGAAELTVVDGSLNGRATDGSTFVVALPFSRAYDGPADAVAFLAATDPPPRWGVLLVRKGGFAIARLNGAEIIESKVGQRHVQGRTKAGGQSQQRFARRRDNQARQAYEAAAEHAARILTGVETLICGGDHTAVDAVLADSRLTKMVVSEPWLAVPDPRRAVLEQAVADAGSVRMSVTNA
jgi:hypothetical protein